MKSFERWSEQDTPICDGSKYFYAVSDTKIDYGGFCDVLKQPANTKLLLCRGVIASVESMTSNQYLEQCSIVRGHNPPIPQNEYTCVDPRKIHKYTELMKRGEKFPLPMLNYVVGNQDGRHRALAALANGAKKIPVITLRYSDQDYLRREFDYPQTWKATKGLLIDNETQAIIGDFSNCRSDYDIDTVIKRAKNAYTHPLMEGTSKYTSDMFKRFIRDLSAFNSDSDIHEEVADCFLDKDHNWQLHFVSRNTGFVDVYLSCTQKWGTIQLNQYNIWILCDILSKLSELHQLLTFVNLSNRSFMAPYMSSTPIKDDFVHQLFVDTMYQTFFTKPRSIGNMLIFEIGDLQIERAFVSINEQNQVSIDYQITKHFVGTINITDYDQQKKKIIDQYDKMVREVNSTHVTTPIKKFVKLFG